MCERNAELHSNPMFRKAMELFRKGDYRGALELFERVKSDTEGGDGRLELYMEVCRREFMRLSQFIESFSLQDDSIDEQMEIRPSVDAAELVKRVRRHVMEGDVEGAYSLLMHHMEEGGEQPGLLAACARLALSAGRLVEAERLALKAASLPSAGARSRILLGNVLLELGRHAEAEEQFNGALREDDSLYGAWYGLGMLYYESKRYELAEQCLRKALYYNPSHINSASLLDELVSQKERLGELMEQVRKELREHPEYSDLHYKLGVYCIQRGDYDEALEHLSRAVEYNPLFVKALVQRGMLYQLAGMFRQACSDFRIALKASGSFDPEHFNRGLDLECNGRWKEAAEEYSEAVRLEPNRAERFIERARVFLRDGLHLYAERELRRSISMAPDYADAHCLLGEALEAQGRFEEASNSYFKALVINPRYERAAEGLTRAASKAGKQWLLAEAVRQWEASGGSLCPVLVAWKESDEGRRFLVERRSGRDRRKRGGRAALERRFLRDRRSRGRSSSDADGGGDDESQ